MTRQEQIRNKAREFGQTYFPDSANIWARPNVEAAYVENACVEMAEWSDQHPNWISVEDELPPRAENSFIFSDYVLVCDNIGYMETACYNFEKNRWDWLNNVTHWMPIVPPRKEEK